MPDLGVDWPDLNAKDAARSAADPRRADRSRPRATAVTTTPASFATRSRSKGLRPIGDAEELLHAFRQQSALEADRKEPGQRRADRPPRARRRRTAGRAAAQPGLLRRRRSSRGSSAPAMRCSVVLDRRPGRAISLRIGRAARARGGRARTRRSCARPSRSRPAIRSSPQDVIAGGRRAERSRSARRASPRPRSASRTSRSTTRRSSRRLVLPVEPGPGGAVRRDPRHRPAAVQRRATSRPIARFKPGDRSSARRSTICAAR